MFTKFQSDRLFCKMHSLIALLICLVLLLTEGLTKSEEGFQYQHNVPAQAKKALLKAINKKRKDLNLPTEIRYDKGLAKRAHQRESNGPVGSFEGESTFDNTWEETLEKVVKLNSRGKTNVAEKIGCEITLNTSRDDGSHTVALYCLLGDKDGNPPRAGLGAAQM